jgi:hypothetical protein
VNNILELFEELTGKEKVKYIFSKNTIQANTAKYSMWAQGHVFNE